MLKTIWEWIFYSAVMIVVIAVWVMQSWYFVVYNFDLVVDAFAIIGVIAIIRWIVKYNRDRKKF